MNTTTVKVVPDVGTTSGTTWGAVGGFPCGTPQIPLQGYGHVIVVHQQAPVGLWDPARGDLGTEGELGLAEEGEHQAQLLAGIEGLYWH